jgi:hypothetical protein
MSSATSRETVAIAVLALRQHQEGLEAGQLLPVAGRIRRFWEGDRPYALCSAREGRRCQRSGAKRRTVLRCRTLRRRILSCLPPRTVVHSRGDMMRDELERPVWQFGLMQDITELRKAEDEPEA